MSDVDDGAQPADVAVHTACPVCGDPVAHDERFCEGCGAELLAVAEVPPDAGPVPEVVVPGRPCQACGGTVDTDGYCGTCGVRAVAERDHWVELPAAWVAGVCDRGIRHERNEDAIALAAEARPGGLAALVVCDGVSSAPDSDVASLAAARAARDVLCSPPEGRELVGAGPEDSTGPGDDPAAAAPVNGAVAVPVAPAPLPADPVGPDQDRASVWGEALERAAAAAHEAAVATASLVTPAGGRDSKSPPSCTFVAAVVEGPLVVTGCIGDSRAYWVPDEGTAVQLTTDDSWAAEAMAQGIPRAEAESGPHAHAITRWLGVDSPDPTPSLVQLTVESPGWLLVCSDGLWNYRSDATDLSALVHEIEAGTGREPGPLAAELVVWANRQGGHDNISVALARLGEPATTPAS